MIEFKALGAGSRWVLVVLLLFAAVNELYRHIEISRLGEFDCRYTGQVRPKGRLVSVDPARALKEYEYVYECRDGVERTSGYRNDKFVRPWETSRN